jgi:hypothetical protein
MRKTFLLLAMLCCSATTAMAQVSIGIGIAVPGVSIGINLPAYPSLALVPGYPVYYAPRLSANLFFYDGLYWVFQGDHWYASSWYNGPWGMVRPEMVPVYVLRVPVRYYRQPPAYFRGWQPDGPPRWDEHWGGDWAQRRGDWVHGDRKSAPPPAPLPDYQREYSGDRYPQQVDQQQSIHRQRYTYQPRDDVVRQHDQQQRAAPPSAPKPQQGAQPQDRSPSAGRGGQKPPQDGGPANGTGHGKGPDGDRGNGDGHGQGRKP